MLTKLYMTGKKLYHPTQYTSHTVSCFVNDEPTSFTIADDELISLGVYQENKLVGYVGRNGIVSRYGDAELVNGRFSPKITDAPPGITIAPIESFFFNKDTIRRSRVLLH